MYKVCEVFSILDLKGYSIKKTGGGRKFSVTPSDKIGVFSTPWTKTDTKQDFLPHRTFFFLWPPGQFCPILSHSDSFSHKCYPPRTVCFVHVTPLGQLFSPFYPPQTVYFDNFTPLGFFFRQFYPLGHLFLRTPLGQKLHIFTPRTKTRIFSTPMDRAIWPHGQKGLFLPPPVFLME